MNLNLSASLNVFKLLTNPGLCLPHATISSFLELPIPLEKAFEKSGRTSPDIRAVVLDKDDCFTHPGHSEVVDAYKNQFEALKTAYPGRRLLIVSNTAGAHSHDSSRNKASEVEKATGVTVLSHWSKKPGCGDEIMSYLRAHPETGVTGPHQIVVVGDRLMTDMMLANMMGSWGLWVRDGVVWHREKSMFSRMERRLAPFLLARGFAPCEPGRSARMSNG